MLGILISLAAVAYYLGNTVKNSIEDSIERGNEGARGGHTYIDWQGRTRLVSDNRLIASCVRLKDGRLADVDAKTWEPVYIYPKSEVVIERERLSRERYARHVEDLKRINERAKNDAIKRGKDAYTHISPYEYGGPNELDHYSTIDILTGKEWDREAYRWNCRCGYEGNETDYCWNCHQKRSESMLWNCKCGIKGLHSKFCTNCGSKRKERNTIES